MAVTAVYDATLSRVRVTATPVPAAAEYVLVERSTDQLTWTTVRGGEHLVPVSGAVSVDDYEFADSVVNYYRASYVDSAVPSLVGAGSASTWNNPTGTDPITPPLPAHITGDLLLAVASIRNTAGVPNAPAGWSKIVDNGNHALIGRRAPSAGTPDPVITFTGGVPNATLIAMTCVLRNAELVPAQQGVLVNASAQNIAYPPMAVTGNNRIILYSAWKQTFWTTVNTQPAGFTELQQASTTLGDDAALVWDYQIQTTATNVAAGSYTVTGGIAAISRTLAAGFGQAAFISQETGSVTPVLGSVWLKSISEPFLNRAVDVILPAAMDVSRASRDGIFEIVGRSYPVGVTDLRASRAWTMQVRTYSVSDADEFELILAAGDPMFIHSPANCQVPGGHVLIGTMTRSWHPLRPEECTFTLPCRQAAAPGSGVVGAVGTWQTVINTYSSWSTEMADNASWAELLQLTGSPADVIVA